MQILIGERSRYVREIVLIPDLGAAGSSCPQTTDIFHTYQLAAATAQRYCCFAKLTHQHSAFLMEKVAWK